MSDTKLALGFAGDLSLAEFNQECDVMRIMDSEIEEFLNCNDANIFNLESTITSEHDEHSSGLNVLDFIKENIPKPIVSLANEHIMDYGKPGLEETLQALDCAGIEYIGAEKNNQLKIKTLVLGTDVKVGILSMFDNISVLKDKTFEGAVCRSQKELIKKHIKKLKKETDWVVMIYHGGGKDYVSVPTPKTRERLKKFLDWGCDIIVSHHTHTVQGFEHVGEKLIIHSLGNFFLDTNEQRKYQRTDNGMLIRISFSKKAFSYTPLPIHLDRNIHFLVARKKNLNFVDLNEIDYKKKWSAECRRVNKASTMEHIEKDEPAVRKSKYSLYTRIVSDQTGLSLDEASKKMRKFCEENGINKEAYVSNRLYRSSKKRTENKLDLLKRKENEYIEKVCVATGWSREDAIKEMDRVKAKYGVSYFKYSAYRFFVLDDSGIEEKLARWKNNLRKQMDYAIQESKWSEDKVRFHMNKVRTVYAFPPEYYTLYKMWELTDEEIAQYARRKDSDRMFAHYNDKAQTAILKDKELFDVNYKDHIKRKFWINKDTNYDEFLEFIDGLKAIFCKPVDSGGGQGTEKIDLADHQDTKVLYEYLIAKDRLLVEECVEQHPAIDAFVPGCVNTMRIVTLFKDGQCHIICASIRFGNKGIIDNFHSDGMACAVDPDTGVILTDAVDRMGYSYKFHPVSKLRFKGFRIPNWDMVIQLAKDAIQVQDGVNYVGWDIAVCADKAVIIEGNAAPDLVLIQAPFAREKKGQKYRFEKYFN